MGFAPPGNVALCGPTPQGKAFFWLVSRSRPVKTRWGTQSQASTSPLLTRGLTSNMKLIGLG